MIDISDVDLDWIDNNLSPKTCLIAGGAAFRLDPDLARRGRADFVAKDVAHFIDFILKWSPRDLTSEF